MADLSRLVQKTDPSSLFILHFHMVYTYPSDCKCMLPASISPTAMATWPCHALPLRPRSSSRFRPNTRLHGRAGTPLRSPLSTRRALSTTTRRSGSMVPNASVPSPMSGPGTIRAWRTGGFYLFRKRTGQKANGEHVFQRPGLKLVKVFSSRFNTL